MWTEEQDKKIKKYYNIYKDLKSEAFFLIAAMLPSKTAKEIAVRLRGSKHCFHINSITELDLIDDDILFAQFPELVLLTSNNLTSSGRISTYIRRLYSKFDKIHTITRKRNFSLAPRPNERSKINS